MAFLSLTKMRTRCALIIILFAGFLFRPESALLASQQQPKTAAEQDLKAAFIYNFTKFVEWPSPPPPGREGAVTICILGDQKLHATMTMFEGRKSGSRNVVIIPYRSINDLNRCDLLFVSGTVSEDFTLNTLSSVQGKGVLTIGESKYFSEHGGMIRFITSNGKLAFDINHAAAKKSGLTISSKVLSLARNRQDIQ
jgi:hypothetical protein